MNSSSAAFIDFVLSAPIQKELAEYTVAAPSVSSLNRYIGTCSRGKSPTGSA